MRFFYSAGSVNLLTHFEKHLPASVSLILDRRGIPPTVRVSRPTSWSALTIMRTVVGLMDRFCEMSVMLQSGLSSMYFRILKILFSVMDICRGIHRTLSKSFPALSKHSISALPSSVSITSVCGGAERVFSVLRSPSSLSSLTYSWTVFHLRSNSSAIWDMGLGPAFTDLSIAFARLSVSTILPTKTPLNTGSGQILGVYINNRVNVETIVLNTLMFKRLNGDKKDVGFWGGWVA